MPPEAFDFGPTGNRRKGICRRCVREREAARDPKRGWTNTRVLCGRLVRACADCGKLMLLDERNFYVAHPSYPETSVQRYDYECKRCASRQSVKRAQRLIRDPERAPALRAQWRDATRRYRERDPERYRRAQRRSYRKRMSTPEGRRAEREQNRIDRRLRAERNGRKVGPSPLKPREPIRPSYIPAKPLADAIWAGWEPLAEEGELTLGDYCETLGLHARQLYAWRFGEIQALRFGTVDRILTAAGLLWWEVYNAERYPEEHEIARAIFEG